MNIQLSNRQRHPRKLNERFKVLSSHNKCAYGYSHIPNAETMQTINEASRGINVVKCTDFDDMFKKLGI
jgi:antitoxin component of RelBE/YafQ-DinJ toxin-antitoxin module